MKTRVPNRLYIKVVLPGRILLSMAPPKHPPFLEGPAPDEGTPRVSRELRGAGVPHARRANEADSGPPPKEQALSD